MDSRCAPCRLSGVSDTKLRAHGNAGRIEASYKSNSNNFVQVLSGILPISRVSAIPACIYQASELLPLEQIYNLVHPSSKSPPVEDKRTWREGMKPNDSPEPPSSLRWTAMDILTAYADRKGWVTAKAGRPDVNRAGNASMF